MSHALPLVLSQETRITLCSVAGSWRVNLPSGAGPGYEIQVDPGQIITLCFHPGAPHASSENTLKTLAVQSHGLVLVIDPDPGKP